jgi:hypothetical protein
MCDHTYCYTPAVGKIREVVSFRLLGDVQYVDSVRVNLGLVRRDCDVLWDLAPHDLSILDFILPEGAAHRRWPRMVRPDRSRWDVHRVSDPAADRWGDRARSRQLAVTDQDPHDDHRWFQAHARVDDLHPTQRISIFDRGVDLTGAEDLREDERREAMISTESAIWSHPRCPSGKD